MPGREQRPCEGQRARVVAHVRRVTLAGMSLNIFVSALKGAGGVASHSQALIADAVHSVSDLVTDLAVIFGVRYWSAPPDDGHPYGHGKIETIVTSFIGIALAAVAVKLVGGAAETLRRGAAGAPSPAAFWIALFSVASKEALFRWTRREARAVNSPSLEANAWHHRSDAISSIPVAIAIAVSRLVPSMGFLDPLGAIFVAVFVLHAAWTIMKPALLELTEGGGKAVADQIAQVALGHPGVREVHHARARRLGSGYQADIHIHVDGGLTVRRGHEIAHEVKRAVLGARLGVSDVIVHVEPRG